MQISVLTPTIRPESLARMQACLARQTFKDFEWLVEVGIPDRGCDLNKALNRMLKRSKGKLIVMYQDYIDIQDTGLERFWELYGKYPKTCFTAPKGVTLGFDEIMINDLENKSIVWDWRSHGVLREIPVNGWEADWASAPRKAFFEIGGYDESFDQGWGFDNNSVAVRMSKLGYNFMVDPENKAVGWNHNNFIEHPFNKPGHLNTQRFGSLQDAVDKPFEKLNYL